MDREFKCKVLTGTWTKPLEPSLRRSEETTSHKFFAQTIKTFQVRTLWLLRLGLRK